MSESDTDDLLCEWSEPRRPYRALHVKHLPQLSDLELICLIQSLETGHYQLDRDIAHLKARPQSEITVTSRELEFKGKSESWFNETNTTELLKYAKELRKNIEKLIKEKEALEVECEEMENQKAESEKTTDSESLDSDSPNTESPNTE